MRSASGTTSWRPNLRADARTVLGALAYYDILTPVLDPEVRALSRFVPPGAVVLDIGAGVGLYAFRLARLAGPAGRVLAFEPFPPSANRLALATRWLSLRNLEIVRSVASAAPGEISFGAPVNSRGRVFDQWAHVQAGPATAGPELRVPATTVDREVDARRFPRVDFIKCDVEGYESEVFRGAVRTLRAHRPVLLCEIEERWCERYGRSADEVLAEIRALGPYRAAVYVAGRFRSVERVEPAHNDYFLLPDGPTD